MIDQISPYFPFALLLLFLALCGFLIWRGAYKAGAYIVQVSAAAFLSSVGGFGLYVMSVIMVTTWLLPGNLTVLAIDTIVTQSIGATIGYAIVKRFGTAANEVSIGEIAISLALALTGSTIGFIFLKDAKFGADFVDNAAGVSGAYFGAVIMGNSPLIVLGFVNVLRNQEP